MDGSAGEHDEVEVEETSSKRRERLIALRSAASASPAAPPPAGSLLPDPDLAGDHHQVSSHRFDFYTNPGAAFSGGGGVWSHKRKSPPHGYPPPPGPPPPYGNDGSNYPPPHQHHMSPSPIHSPSLMPRDAPGSSPWRSPMQFQGPMPGYQGTPGHTPPWSPHSASPGLDSYPNSPSYGFRHPNPGRGAGPMNYGPRGNPYPSYRQGRGQNYYNNNQGSRGRGGGRGFQNRPGRQDLASFNKCMVDDPWQDLAPVVGNILMPRGRGDSNSWLPESLRTKKETPAQGLVKPTSSGLSLAEYLDLSFNEASKET